MDEIGVDISGQRSKGVTENLGKLAVDYMIVVCGGADEKCPTVWPGATARLFWPLNDPAAVDGTEAQRLDAFRTVRDQIDVLIREWLAGLTDPKREALTKHAR